MAMSGQNPFAHLLEEDAETAETDRRKRIGTSEQNRLLPKYGIPKSALAMPPEQGGQQPPTAKSQPNPFSNLLEDKKEGENTFLGQLPSTDNAKKMFHTPEMIDELIGNLSGLKGMKVINPKASVGFGQALKSYMKKIVPEEVAETIQKSHDKLSQQASNIYDLIKSEVTPRGVNNIPLAQDVLTSAESYLPKTRATKALIDKVKTGDYEAIHQLQSDLGTQGTKQLGADLAADRNAGEEMLDVREKINEAIRDKFNSHGHSDLSKLLDEANEKYTKLKDVYYKHPSIAKLVHPESRKMPKNPMNLFSEKSVPMGKVLAEHPEVAKAVKTTNEANQFIKKLKTGKNIGIAGSAASAIAGGGLYGGKKLIDMLINRGGE